MLTCFKNTLLNRKELRSILVYTQFTKLTPLTFSQLHAHTSSNTYYGLSLHPLLNQGKVMINLIVVL